MKLLVANRGEIAIRIFRAARELGIETVAVFSKDDSDSLHIRGADHSQVLQGYGAAAYLDMDRIIAIAKALNCTAIHPGYGFLSEKAEFAKRCGEAGLLFVGPAAETLELFGDKGKARELAQQCKVPLVPGTSSPASLEEIRGFFLSLGEDQSMMIKAVAGGGGRGMRKVSGLADLEEAFRICQSEAQSSFDNNALYAEKRITMARHIEVQIVGDGSGNMLHLGERECTLQRRHQKLIEVAPSPSLSEAFRAEMTAYALRLAQASNYRSLGTFEFLVEMDEAFNERAFYFMEANPRLQVEHTVTEEAHRIDLVKLQLELARGQTLAELGVEQAQISRPRGASLQLRVNMEETGGDGEPKPAGGMLHQFSIPSGPGIRVDTFGYSGYSVNPRFDSLLAKVIVSSPTAVYGDLITKAYHALGEFQVEGVATNIGLLQNLLSCPEVKTNRITTSFVSDRRDTLNDSSRVHQNRFFKGPSSSPAIEPTGEPDMENAVAVRTVVPGTVISIDVVEGDLVVEGQTLAVVESMKMQHIIKSAHSGCIRLIAAKTNDSLRQNQAILYLDPMAVEGIGSVDSEKADPDRIRPDLADVIARHQKGLDEFRPQAVERRRKTGQRTARENIDDLLDEGSFIEYGALAVAAQRSRTPLDQLIEKSPADGLIAGVGTVNGTLFDHATARCLVISYDYTVLAGTQGLFNHKKTDRLLHLAKKWKLPLILFAEGGGGRPGDVDGQLTHVAGLDYSTFTSYAGLSGLVPLVGIVSGRCFAGNAALLGCSDVIIATENANIGMGGPAMIEGGGLGKCRPEEIGPIGLQSRNGVVDIRVRDEAEAVETAKRYLSYFQGVTPGWECTDQRLLRQCIPENRLRVYDIRGLIRILADQNAVLELRKEFGVGMVTALIRIEGIPFGLLANNPMHLGGAIDADGADKASRFMQLCDAFDLPILVLSDTPGFMVGTEAEKSAQVRHFSRLFVTGAGISTPLFSVVLRKGYGLGSMAMVGGNYHEPFFNVAWPTGEFGGMGLEGAVKLGFKKELDAVSDPQEKQALFDSMVAMAYEHGKATNMASFLEIDAVIDPMETRRWVVRGYRSLPRPARPPGKKRPNIDTW